MRAGGTLLEPADGKSCSLEGDLVPTKVRQLARSQAMSEGAQDHRIVTVCPAVALVALRSIWAWVRYSRVLRSALGQRFGMAVRFSVAGVTSFKVHHA